MQGFQLTSCFLCSAYPVLCSLLKREIASFQGFTEPDFGEWGRRSKPLGPYRVILPLRSRTRWLILSYPPEDAADLTPDETISLRYAKYRTVTSGWDYDLIFPRIQTFHQALSPFQ